MADKTFEERQTEANAKIAKILEEYNLGIRAELRYTEYGIVSDPVLFDNTPKEDGNTETKETSEEPSGESATPEA